MKKSILAVPLLFTLGCVNSSTNQYPIPSDNVRGYCEELSFFQGEVSEMEGCVLFFDNVKLTVDDYRLFEDVEEVPPSD